MKRLSTFLAVTLLAVGCSKIFDTSVLERNIIELKDRVTALEEQCKQMNTNISSLQTIVTALQNNDFVTGVAPITQSGVEVGYTITFSKSGAITIYHGKDGSDGLNGSDGSNGSDGASGSTPVVGVKQDTDGVYYWTLNGEWLLNDKGEKVKAISTDGKDGEDGTDGANGKDGKDGITPQLKIENGYWYVSYNNGESWESLGKATGENGSDGAAGKEGDSFFQSVTQDENNVIFTLADGTVLTVPRSSSYLFNKLQSVSYVPRYSDGKATVYYSSTANSQLELDFEVSPKDAVAQIAAQWQEILTVKAINTQTRAVTYIDMPILDCTADTQHGVITVTASGSNLAANFYSGEQTVSARLGISDGNTNITSEYIQLAAAPATEPFANEIWYTSTDGNIVTPHDSTVFGANIISNTYENGKGVVVFDNNITKIGTEAFSGCHNLTSVNIPNSISLIEFNAFINCIHLTRVSIPDNSVVQIESQAFVNCYDLANVTIPNSVTSIGSCAFGSCHSLTSVTIPDSVTTMEYNPFKNCINLAEFHGKFASTDNRCLIVDGVLNSFAPSGLTTYTISNDVTFIGTWAFAECNELTNITIPDSVTTIAHSAFVCCSSLSNITLPESITVIGNDAFFGCGKLTSITIPDSVTSIEHNAFRICSSLTSFYGKYASTDNRCLIVDGALNSFAPAGLTQYTIPDGVTQIGDAAFYLCDSLTNITIPDGVITIGWAAFSGCSSLISINFPDSVTSIENYAFESCHSLTSIYCKPTTPPTTDFNGQNSWFAFDYNAADRKIYVPTESVDAYKAADGWEKYADAIVGYNFAQ